jgi:hypothetical protein
VTWEDPIAYCRLHAEDVALADSPPPDPLTELPTIAAELQHEHEGAR